MPDWFRMDPGLTDHPKTVRLQRELGSDRKAAVGVVTLLLAFVTKYASDGLLSDGRIHGLADALDLSPGHDDGSVIELLTRCGFVESGPGMCPIMHGYDERNGRHIYESERKARWRADKRLRDRGSGAGLSQDVPGTHAPTGRTRRTGRTDVTNGRKGQRPEQPESAAPEARPAGPTDPGSITANPGGADPAIGDLEVRFPPGSLTLAADRFPDRDVTLIATKLATRHPYAAPEILGRALWGWCESARREDTERKPGVQSPADQGYDSAATLRAAEAMDGAGS